MAHAGTPDETLRPARRARPLARARLRAAVDRLARGVVTAGGLAVIGSILGILLFLVWEVEPLFRAARVEPGRSGALAAPAAALLVDEHRTHVVALGPDGVARAYRAADGGLALERRVADVALQVLAPAGDDALLALDAGGRVAIAPVTFEVSFDAAGARRVLPRIGAPETLVLDEAGGAIGAFTARSSAAGTTALGQLTAGELAVVRRTVETNPFSGETTESLERRRIGPLPPLSRLVLDPDQRLAYAAVEGGGLLWLDLRAGPGAPVPAPSPTEAPVSALALLNGGRGLVVGDAGGGISVWLLARREDGSRALQRIRTFPAHAAPATGVAVSQRGRSFLVVDAAGGLGLYHSTSERVLWRGEAPAGADGAPAFAPKEDALLLAGAGRFAELELASPHPEVSLAALFGRIWYEGASAPAWVWQSTGGTDEFEPKLSLVPLIVGTLKGTLYSLLLSVPLAVFGAMYTSQFMHPGLQRFVKPTVELMASLPSVVLGFLAGLWLAPRVEQVFPALILAVFALPLGLVGGGFLWGLLPASLRRWLPDGSEVAWLMVVTFVALGACLEVGPLFEGVAFAGSFQGWLFETSGLRYDQRNAIVVGLAMGFAVIPIIFAIAEDAFSNVPVELVAGSRALGASRLQTVLRVVLPTASPGIFSGTMVGFGRAVGETMIVLMATGNTPLLDWNPFNGFRTLSANIAVEIPEAPVGGTLYRTLFVAALLLFALTFLINTVAELIRHRLRARYARL